MFNKVYLIPSYKCNLNCPHCDIHLIKEELNEDNFFNTLSNIEANEVVYFGGEPLLNKKLFVKCLETNKITSLSTNLLLLNEEYIELLKKYNLNIATSWNPHRFNDLEYQIWLAKLKLLKKYGLSCIVLITLTEDLFNMDMNEVLVILKEIDNTKAVDGIQFEHLIDYNASKDLHQKADEWLCEIHNCWQFDMKNIIDEMVMDWNFDCSKTYTLTPNGTLKKGCPQYVKAVVCEDCYNCQLATICRPCTLQQCCSFPKRLYGLINI